MKPLWERHLNKSQLAIIAVLAAFLAIADTIVFVRHKHTLYSEFTEASQDDLQLLAMLAEEAVEQHDIPALERLLRQWGSGKASVVELTAEGAGGITLAKYRRSNPAEDSVTFTAKVSGDNQGSVQLKLVKDTDSVAKHLKTQVIDIGIISLLIMLTLALSLSFVLRRLTIAPLTEEINRRKVLLVKMRRIRNENQRLLEAAGEGIFSIQKDGICTFINDTALAMLGLKRGEVVGRNIHRMIHHTDQNGVQCVDDDCQIMRALHSGEAVTVDEDCFWRSNGACFPVMYSASPLDDGRTHIGIVVVFHDITEQRTERMILEHQATHDPLTGLVNRREFERRLDRAIDTARQEDKEHVLLYMDLDNFKQVNDVSGHNAGDELLRRLAKKMSGLMRERDTLARLGGDEFVVLLEHCSQEVALRIGDQIIEAVCGEKFFWDGKQFVIGVSIGLVALNSGCTNSDAALYAADGACYLAKQLGGCQLQVWSPELLESKKIH